MRLFCKKMEKMISNSYVAKVCSKMFLRTQGSKSFRICILMNRVCRRVSSGAARASMTVESAIVVPLFIFCMLDLLFGIQVMETSSRITAALHQTGSEICSYAYAAEHVTGDAPSGLVSTVYAIGSVTSQLGSTVQNRGGILGGRAGIIYTGSSILEDNGIVRLNARYTLKFPVKLGFIRPFILGTSMYGHAWVGYDGIGTLNTLTDEDPIVYITPTGTVYHRDYDCRYLHPSVTSVAASAVSSLRSSDGSIYYPCEICGGGSMIGNVFITGSGNRFHSDLFCPGIKRNIIAIHLSEVGGRSPCSICGY